jgi:hypothetical protein
MNLQQYVDAVRHELDVAAAPAGEEAQRLAERLSAPLESAMRLALLEALSDAADEITGELAPRSVEVRLRGRDPEFVLSAAEETPRQDEGFAEQYDDDGGTWRVTLRLPEGLRSAVEAAARRDGASLNSWLVRAAAAACRQGPSRAGQGQHRNSGHRVTGWVR